MNDDCTATCGCVCGYCGEPAGHGASHQAERYCVAALKTHRDALLAEVRELDEYVGECGRLLGEAGFLATEGPKDQITKATDRIDEMRKGLLDVQAVVGSLDMVLGSRAFVGSPTGKKLYEGLAEVREQLRGIVRNTLERRI